MSFQSDQQRFISATRAAYARWAPLYASVPHNPLMRVEQRVMLEYWPTLAGRRVLDLACGTGRYSHLALDNRAAQVTAVDFCAPMLVQVAGAVRVCASMMQLPFAHETFDVVLCGLAVGHATDISSWMSECARVLRPGGTLLYSDFHPAAAQAGLTRSFKDADARTHHVPFRCFAVEEQKAAAQAQGLEIDVLRDVRVGIEMNESYPNSEAFYQRWHGLPVVLVVRAHKSGL